MINRLTTNWARVTATFSYHNTSQSISALFWRSWRVNAICDHTCSFANAESYFFRSLKPSPPPPPPPHETHPLEGQERERRGEFSPRAGGQHALTLLSRVLFVASLSLTSSFIWPRVKTLHILGSKSAWMVRIQEAKIPKIKSSCKEMQPNNMQQQEYDLIYLF